MTSYCVYTNLVLFLCFISCNAANYPELRLLSVVFRHGDRRPNDSRNGDLTNVGRQRAYRLGETLRMEYGDFLGDIYEPAAVSARSTEYARAKMSLQLFLAALYIPQKHQRWHESLNWQPIPFSSAPFHNDILLFPKFCPRFIRELDKVESSPEYQKLLEPYREMFSNLTIATGEEMKNSNDMFLLYHKLSSLQSMNETLPNWSHDIFPDGLLLSGTYLEYDFLKFNDWLRKINGGTLMRKIIDDMLNKTKDDPINVRKLYVYSAHELNIVAILQTLKVWKPHIPGYSSTVIVELREHNKNYYVKILYNDGILGNFKEIRTPGCPSLCPLNVFIKSISDELPTYKEIICDSKTVNINDVLIV